MFLCAALNLKWDQFLFDSFGSVETIKCEYWMKQEMTDTQIKDLHPGGRKCGDRGRLLLLNTVQEDNYSGSLVWNVSSFGLISYNMICGGF